MFKVEDVRFTREQRERQWSKPYEIHLNIFDFSKSTTVVQFKGRTGRMPASTKSIKDFVFYRREDDGKWHIIGGHTAVSWHTAEFERAYALHLSSLILGER